MNYKSFNLGDWIGYISGVIEDETTLDGNEMEDLVWFLTTLKQEPCEDIMSIHTQGLDEGIRCAMCTNSMKSNRGCDGGCVINEDMYREVMNTIKNHIVPPVTPTQRWIPVSERLPEESGDYLIAIADSSYKYGQFFEVSWFYPSTHSWSYLNANVIAWMPLPKSYIESEEH